MDPPDAFCPEGLLEGSIVGKGVHPRRVAEASGAKGHGRVGLLAVAADGTALASESGKPCSWGALALRLLVLLLAFALCAAAHGVFVGRGLSGDEYWGPGLLASVGISWDTWWGTVVCVVVMVLGFLSLPLTALLVLLSSRLRHATALFFVLAACGCMVYAIPLGNAAGESLWLYDLQVTYSAYDAGRLWSYGVLRILPGLLISAACVVVGVATACVARSWASRAGLRRPRVVRLAAVAVPFLLAPLFVLLGHLNLTAAIVSAALLAAFLFEVIPNEVNTLSLLVRTGRTRKALWPAVFVVLGECGLMIALAVTSAYGI